MRLNNAIFSDKPINNGRQAELDLAKAVILFFLAFIHCTIECTPEPQLSYGIPYLFDTIIGGPLSAPMFMFAMGVGMVYTNKNTPKAYAARGIRIGIIAYLLNICRFLIPFTIGYIITGDYDKYIDPLLYRVLGNDILQFACLAMLCIALFVKLRIPNLAMFLICVGMSLLGTFLNGIDVGTPLGNIFLGYIIGTEDAAGKVFSDFPLMNWLIIPVSGYIFGKILLYVKNKKLFYGILSSIGVIITVIYFSVGINNRLGMFGEGQNCYYHLITPDAFACLAATIGAIGIYYAIIGHLPHRVQKCIGEISRNINAIYCIHWVYITISINVILYILKGSQVLSVPLTMLISACISIVSILTAHFWSEKIKTKLFGVEK